MNSGRAEDYTRGLDRYCWREERVMKVKRRTAPRSHSVMTHDDRRVYNAYGDVDTSKTVVSWEKGTIKLVRDEA